MPYRVRRRGVGQYPAIPDPLGVIAGAYGVTSDPSTNAVEFLPSTFIGPPGPGQVILPAGTPVPPSAVSCPSGYGVDSSGGCTKLIPQTSGSFNLNTFIQTYGVWILGGAGLLVVMGMMKGRR